ncbi:MAG TPA: radical SAM protein [Candidatus Ozemobacteraceae bacterium]|nr:radical SAM protein [Candidatus Ozemobacteraceae bacterium]
MIDFFDGVRQTGGISSFFWEVTARCNQHCPICYLPEPASHDELPASLISRLIRELRELHCLTVTLSGGEPFLRPDLLDLITMFRESGMGVVVFTNGSCVENRHLIELARLGVSRLEVTVFSTMPEVAAAMGCHDVAHVMQTVTQAMHLGIIVTIKTPVTTRNYPSLPELVTWCQQLGLRHQLDPLIQSPEDKHSSPGDLLEPRQAAQLLGDVTCSCNLSADTIAMRWDGMLIPCLTIPRPIGRWPQQSLREVIESPITRQVWQQLGELPVRCRSCALVEQCPRCPGLFHSECAGEPWPYLCDIAQAQADERHKAKRLR